MSTIKTLPWDTEPEAGEQSGCALRGLKIEGFRSPAPGLLFCLHQFSEHHASTRKRTALLQSQLR